MSSVTRNILPLVIELIRSLTEELLPPIGDGIYGESRKRRGYAQSRVG